MKGDDVHSPAAAQKLPLPAVNGRKQGVEIINGGLRMQKGGQAVKRRPFRVVPVPYQQGIDSGGIFRSKIIFIFSS